MIENKFESEKNWYAIDAADNDVIISTRVRLARNLANFPFVPAYRQDDEERIQALIYDAFGKLKDPDNYHFLDIKNLDPLSTGILMEQGYIKLIPGQNGMPRPAATGIFINTKGEFSAVINCIDHLHLSAFSTGLNIRNIYNQCKNVDDQLQDSLQFAASCKFGYLTTSLLSVGTGLKLTSRVHLPAVFYAGKVKEFLKLLADYKLKIVPSFGSSNTIESAFGKYFQISNAVALKGSEVDQLANFESALLHIAEFERKILAELADNRKTINRHNVIQAYSLGKFSLLLDFPRAMNIISDIHLGIKLGILQGISNNDICRLIYHVQNSHLEFLLKNEQFDFEDDIKDHHVLVLDRLRAMIVHEAIEKITLGNV